jgi:hypothetical protein
VRIPNLKPGEVVAYRDNGDDTITLTKVNGEASEPFPEGSLSEYVADWNKEFGPVARGLKVPVPPKED